MHRSILPLLLLLAAAGCATRAPRIPPPPAAVADGFESGVRLLEAGHAAEAEAALQAHLERHPEDAEASLYLGRAVLAQERWQDAVDRFQDAVDLAPESVDAYLWLGKALAERIERMPVFGKMPVAQRIRAVYERAAELDPDRYEPHVALARFYSEAPAFAGGDPAQALHHAEELRRIEPLRGELMLGRLHERWGQLEEAAAAYRAALGIEPGHPEATAGLERVEGKMTREGRE
jgi:tetratricopeptide (TPR) repeat protein